MKSIKNLTFLALLLLVSLYSCKTEKEETSAENEVDPYITEVRDEYAPDSRIALFDVEANDEGEVYVLKGESNMPEAVSSLKQKLEAQNISYKDSIALLPSADLEGKTEGVVKISVANLRSKPAHSSELVTQATLGMPLKVYKKDGGWYYVQTPEGYLAWVDYGGITPMTPEELAQWKATDKVMYLHTAGSSYEEPNAEAGIVSDLVAGNVLELVGEKSGFYEVKYPSDKSAFIKKQEAQPYEQWLASLDPTGESLIETSKTLKGLPYLWGGTSPKGVDCSGYTKTIYFLNGMVIPRDASQQIRAGVVVDSTKNFENLAAGDLLYFGRKATDTTSERIIHVGMWIGDNKFIHSMGEVHISNMDTAAEDFDEYNYNRYLRTKRVLGHDDEKIIRLAESNLFTDRNTDFKE
ncbi:C40 family peptidase [Salinimicrobium terrae]|uniref:C40 family peptidase n=1 Tax=Salinimicrobium terrae TaxID=470866 RepID=UPI0003FEB2A2|nr:C40 family peptidase [Salinimicrobium terrae]